jgi:hypothetical protein
VRTGGSRWRDFDTREGQERGMRNPSCGKGEIKIADILNLDEK